MILKRGSIVVAAAALALWAAGARAQEWGYDCVIEPYMVVDLGSAADGVIEKMLVSRGDRVTAGQPVAWLESKAERAALRIAEARANEYVRIDLARNQIALIEKEAERTQKLAAKKLTAENILETVMSQLKQAQLELQLAEYQRNTAVLEKLRTEAELERRIVRSPIDGVVMRRLIGPGEYVYSQAQIVRIAKIDPLHVEVFLPTELYPSLSVGTRSVAASETLSDLLTERNLPHRVLNARQNKGEADIVAQAGTSGQITVATNMAGRGTDIKLGPGVWGLGGLHVLGTELHDSARIDRQLFGRCGRQGEPGTYQMIISLEDEIITDAFGGRLKWVIRYFSGRTGRIPGLVAWPIFWIAQAAAERRNSNIRRSLLRYDDNLEDLLAFTGRSE